MDGPCHVGIQVVLGPDASEVTLDCISRLQFRQNIVW